jgi:hypothetical protein
LSALAGGLVASGISASAGARAEVPREGIR